MDALALLCTLHADGPATLKNLRQAGCGSLEAIESMEEERLARLLGGPPAVARRFVREARHLRERLAPGILDREETHVDGPADGIAVAGAGGRSRDGRFEMERGERPIETERDPMAEVLDAWRERDAEEAPESRPESQERSREYQTDDPPAEGTETTLASEDEIPPRPIRARPEFEFGTELATAVREMTSAVTPGGSGVVATPIPKGAFEGVEADLALHLAEQGACDLHELGDEEILALSQRLGIGYTRILRMVQLSRRAAMGSPTVPSPTPSAIFGQGVVEGAAAAVPAVAVETDASPKLSPADRPRRSEPSILELEWNLEIQPKPPPPGHVLPERPERNAPEPRHENAGGPFA